MANLFQLAAPQTGVDYGEMAQLMRPQMQQLGPSPLHALSYTQDQNKQHQMLQRAATLAALDAQMKAQQAAEYGAEAPGREAERNAKIEQAKSAERMVPVNERTKTNEAQAKEVQSVIKQLEPHLNAWEGDTTPEGRQAVVSLMREGPTSSEHSRKLAGLPPDQIDLVMRALRRAQTETLETLQKRESNKTKLDIAKTVGEARLKVADIQGRYNTKLKQMGLDSKEKQENEMNRLRRKASQGELTETEFENYLYLNSLPAFAADVRQTQNPGVVELVDAPGGKGKEVVRTKPPKVAVPQPPQSAKKSTGPSAATPAASGTEETPMTWAEYLDKVRKSKP